MPNLAWIGLGNMGIAMAANLAESIKPSELKVYNRTQSRSEELAKKSSAIIDICSSLEELSGTDIFFVCLANDDALTSTIDSLLHSNVELKGRTVCDMSTVHPDTTRSIATKLREIQCQFVAAPVFGAPPAAVAAKLVVAKAGPEDAMAVVEPYFASMSRTSFSLGTDPGLASLMKITGNSFILSMIETIAEGLTFSESSGLGVANTMKFISTMFSSTPWESYAQRMVTGAYMPSAGQRPAFAVDVALKDCSHALSIAQDSNYTMSILTHVKENLKNVSKDPRYEGRGDVSSVYGVERERASLTLENKAIADARKG